LTFLPPSEWSPRMPCLVWENLETRAGPKPGADAMGWRSPALRLPAGPVSVSSRPRQRLKGDPSTLWAIQQLHSPLHSPKLCGSCSKTHHSGNNYVSVASSSPAARPPKKTPIRGPPQSRASGSPPPPVAVKEPPSPKEVIAIHRLHYLPVRKAQPKAVHTPPGEEPGGVAPLHTVMAGIHRQYRLKAYREVEKGRAEVARQRAADTRPYFLLDPAALWTGSRAVVRRVQARAPPPVPSVQPVRPIRPAIAEQQERGDEDEGVRERHPIEGFPATDDPEGKALPSSLGKENNGAKGPLRSDPPSPPTAPCLPPDSPVSSSTSPTADDPQPASHPPPDSGYAAATLSPRKYSDADATSNDADGPASPLTPSSPSSSSSDSGKSDSNHS
jgi:hypothetical protein